MQAQSQIKKFGKSTSSVADKEIREKYVGRFAISIIINIFAAEEHPNVRGRYCRDHRINKTACQICTNF